MEIIVCVCVYGMCTHVCVCACVCQCTLIVVFLWSLTHSSLRSSPLAHSVSPTSGHQQAFLPVAHSVSPPSSGHPVSLPICGHPAAFLCLQQYLCYLQVSAHSFFMDCIMHGGSGLRTRLSCPLSRVAVCVIMCYFPTFNLLWMTLKNVQIENV